MTDVVCPRCKRYICGVGRRPDYCGHCLRFLTPGRWRHDGEGWVVRPASRNPAIFLWKLQKRIEDLIGW